MYKAQQQGQIPPGDKCLIVNNSYTTLSIHCKFQLIVFNTFNTFLENDFSKSCMGSQIWPCQKVIGHPRITISTNLVDLESPMPYTKIQS